MSIKSYETTETYFRDELMRAGFPRDDREFREMEYVLGLLTHARTSGGLWSQKPASIQALEALMEDPIIGAVKIQQLGDDALLMTGLYSEYLKRKNLLELYSGFGVAFFMKSSELYGGRFPLLSEILRFMALNFNIWCERLSKLSEKWRSNSELESLLHCTNSEHERSIEERIRAYDITRIIAEITGSNAFKELVLKHNREFN